MPKPGLIYFIASVNRSGSSWLCALLRSTGVVGEPRELLRQPRENFGDRIAQDVCCVKAQLPLMRRLWRTLDQRHRDAAKFLYLRRQDTLRQAISLYRARQTGIWHLRLDRGALQDREHKHQAAPFDCRAILRKKRQVEAHYARWEAWFRKQDLRPLRVTYEQLCESPTDVVHDITAFLGRPYRGQISDYTKIMRDEITEQWVDKLER